jgi:hypothetical protein
MLAAGMTASAQTAATAATPGGPGAPPKSSPAEEWIQKSKKPFDWMTWGADLRLRHELVQEANFSVTPVNNEMNYFRIRPRIWTTISPANWVDLNARMANEMRYFFKPDDDYLPRQDAFQLDEFIIDNLNAKLKFFDNTLSFIVGRQDVLGARGMEFQNGWLLGDGTPLDGSRTYFIDAARMTYDWKDKHTVFNAIFIEQSAESDSWLKPLNDQFYRNNLTEQDDRGVFLYVSNTSLKNTQLDAFFIYTDHHDPVLPTGLDGEVYTFGVRGKGTFAENWSYDASVAPQLGNSHGRDLQAFGAYGQVDYNFNDAHKNSLRLGVEYLSGDDPDTADDETFDPLWGRWPQWSELLVFTTVEYGKPAYWANMIRPHVGWTMLPMDKMHYTLDYSALWSAEGYDDHPVLGNADGFKGHLFQTVLTYTFNKHVRGRIHMEYFLPGSFYTNSDDRDEDGFFVRTELNLTY